jgi:hypothetical protein
MDDEARRANGIDSLPGSLEEALKTLKEDKLMCDTWASMSFPSTLRERKRSGIPTDLRHQLGAEQIHRFVLIAFTIMLKRKKCGGDMIRTVVAFNKQETLDSKLRCLRRTVYRTLPLPHGPEVIRP